MKEQSSLGRRKEHWAPSYIQDKMARVTSIKDLYTYGRIEAIFLDYGQPMPIWVVGDIDREPVEGDEIIVGYMDGRKDAPYLMGFVKNGSYTTNFAMIKKDLIRLQLPVFGIGTAGSKATTDAEGNLMDDARQPERAFLELSPSHAVLSFPTSESGATPPATITITASEVTITHPGTIKHGSGAQGVARVGDSIQVTVGGTTYTGAITTGSTKTKID